MLRKTHHGPQVSNRLSPPLRSVPEDVLMWMELGTPLSERPATQVLWSHLPMGEVWECFPFCRAGCFLSLQHTGTVTVVFKFVCTLESPGYLFKTPSSGHTPTDNQWWWGRDISILGASQMISKVQISLETTGLVVTSFYWFTHARTHACSLKQMENQLSSQDEHDGEDVLCLSTREQTQVMAVLQSDLFA